MAESRKPVISVHDLAKNYGELKVLRKIDMDIYKGEVVSVIGPSGSGKSTFLRCLNYLEELTSGEIDIGGVSLKGIDEDKHNKKLNEKAAKVIRKNVGMVFQQPNPFPMSVYDNIAYGPRTHGIRNHAKLDEIVERSLRQAAIWDELKDRLKKSALGLSGGQQQRTSIGRALITRPSIVLADEPTGNLDTKASNEIMHLLKTSNRELNQTIIMITHNMELAKAADRTIMIEDGKIR